MKKYTPNKDGVYSTLVWDGTYKDGKKHRKQIKSKKSSADLERKVAEFKRQVDNKTSCTKTNYTFCEYAKYWLDNYKPDIRQTTRQHYEIIIQTYFKPLVGVPLNDIRRIHLVMVISENKASVRRHIYLLFKQVIKCAIREHYLSSNTLDDIFLDYPQPKIVKKEKRVLTAEEREAVFNADFKDTERMYLHIAYGCGLRREEILALEASDFNLKEKTLNVNKVIVFGKDSKPILENSTKTPNSMRTVPIPEYLVSELKAYLPTHKVLFTNRKGNYYTLSSYVTLWNNIVKKINAYVGYESKLTSHTFRHNYCSMLCYQVPEISIKKISQIMGDSMKVVMEVYTHTVEDKEKISTAINSAVGYPG